MGFSKAKDLFPDSPCQRFALLENAIPQFSIGRRRKIWRSSGTLLKKILSLVFVEESCFHPDEMTVIEVNTIGRIHQARWKNCLISTQIAPTIHPPIHAVRSKSLS